MPGTPSNSDLTRQGAWFVLAGGLQLLLDWALFVVLTWLGMAVAPANLAGRVGGALLGFWFNGRFTFARDGQARLGSRRLLKFLALWIPLTLISTLLVGRVAGQLGLHQAWIAKPAVESGLAVVSFFLWRRLVYR